MDNAAVIFHVITDWYDRTSAVMENGISVFHALICGMSLELICISKKLQTFSNNTTIFELRQQLLICGQDLAHFCFDIQAI